MDVYRVKTGSILPLGKQGENLARKIQFDLSRWISNFGPGTVQLLHQRSGDEAPYPVAVEQNGTQAIWTVTNADTAVPGTGHTELQYHVGDALAKSETWMTKVLLALGPASETPPEAQQGWVDQVLQAGAAAAEAAEKAANAAVRQPIVGSNGNWWTWDLDTGAYVDTGIYSGGDAPYIGENGNWYVGQTDTGVASTGPAGPAGETGPQGPAGAALTVTNTASVGQTVKITAVDENGQPAEWEAVDMASGGGGITAKVEKVYTLEEAVSMFTIPTSDFDPAIYPAVQIAFFVPADCTNLEVGMTTRDKTCKLSGMRVNAGQGYHLLFIGMDNLDRNIPLAVGLGQGGYAVTWREAGWWGYNNGKTNGFYLQVSEETPFPAGAKIRVRSV